MANSRNRPPVTPFSAAFAASLREVMTARSVTQTKVAQAINRDQTFVSERTSGKRPCDTDIIAGVAQVAGVDAKTIVREVLAKMRGDITAAAPVAPDPKQAPGANLPTLADKRKKRTYPQPAKRAARKSTDGK